ncbi:HK97 family phage prohead protease [uncultured Methanobrevibacter sp.]|uniref:HK97 family phage prohead protease n=1 Tax=uncultured Methanobrevibacter sp. TaxID=253161 RepID=UPI00262B79B1|nr:HK97 family phage prohead protease [uncultured Methanobrevibacter sp.]
MKIIIRADHVHIEGYVNAVERLSKPITERLGTFRERVMAGTFKKALKKAQDVRILLNHNEDRDLGGIKDGNLKLEEDSIGLRAEADIFDKDVIKDAKAGNLVGWSFGFFPIESRDTSEDGMPIKELHEIDLREVSLLNKRHTPAYDGTLVAVRDNDEKMIIGETMLAEAVDIREETENQDETINEALAEIREKSSDEKAQDEKPEKKTEVSSEYFAGYKTMIAEMKA